MVPVCGYYIKVCMQVFVFRAVPLILYYFEKLDFDKHNCFVVEDKLT